jgi:hypothetical protein
MKTRHASAAIAIAVALAGLPAAARSDNHPPGFVWDPIADFGRDRPVLKAAAPDMPDLDAKGAGVWWWQYKDSLSADGDYTDVGHYYSPANRKNPTSVLFVHPWKRYRSPTIAGSPNYNPVIFDCGSDADGDPLLAVFVNRYAWDYLGVLTWESPVGGTIRITGTLSLEASAGRSGSMDWSFDLNPTPEDRGSIGSGTLSNTNPSNSVDLTVKVKPGDRISFVVNHAEGTTGNKGTAGSHGIVLTNNLKYTLAP